MISSSEEAKKVRKLVTNESDIGGVLILTSYLDSILESILRTRLKGGRTTEKLLKSGSGVLGTFTSRAELCYSLELIDNELFSELKTISEIRNIFAHNHLSASFKDDKISKLCGMLREPDRYLEASETKEEREQQEGLFNSSKARFSCSIYSAIDQLAKEKISLRSRRQGG